MTLRPQIALAGSAFAALSLALSSFGNPSPPSEEQERVLQTLFAQLGSDDFGTRQRAQVRLQQLAADAREQVLGESLDTYLEAIDPEVRYRLRAAMYNIVSADMKAEGFIGIRMMDAPMRILNGGNIVDERAVQILTVLPDTAAERSGLRPGDRILKLDGNAFDGKLEAYLELSEYIRSKTAGQKVKLSIKRGLQDLDIEIQLGARPEGLDEGRKERAFAEWMESALVDRGHLPKPKEDELKSSSAAESPSSKIPSRIPFRLPPLPEPIPKP